MTARTAHIGVDRQSRIEKQRPPEFDAFPGYWKLRSRHVFGQGLENFLRLPQQRGVVRRGRHTQNRKGRRDTSCVERKLGHLRPPNSIPWVRDRESQQTPFKAVL